MAAFGNNTREICDNERWEVWEKVTIRPLTNHEHNKILFELQKGRKNKGVDGLRLTDAKKMAQMVLEKCIVSWTFTQDGMENGDVAEITVDAFNDLPKHYSDFIEKEIEEFTPDDDS